MSERLNSPPDAEDAPRGKILVIDDQPANIMATHQILHPQHQVFMATSGRQGIALCLNSPPDLVLLDVEMPEMDGMEVCRELKRHPDTQHIPIIFITGHSGQEQETACWEAGAVDFVSKPVNPSTLRNRVKSHLLLKRQSDQLKKLAFSDGLTGIANRRRFDECLQREWSRCQRSALPLALIMSDVDYFKRFNDRYGHHAGDDCLRQIAGAMQAQLNRPYDLAARFGGEEFACLLPDTDLAGAQAVAERIAAAIQALQIEHSASERSAIVTLSIGLACRVPRREEPHAALIQEADRLLYQAKAEGRGKICSGGGIED
ncbi:diguanylate cyclase [Chromobacterium sp. IIBBL 290-4]|uniref:diguanylate cyclase n=1 Tax=Chromobacterium sp. IIBBL 290-4 TaxID=2953890 RepID=UPI0020B6C64F|nr:diguanylate cyclase [Chromobacterium sp. IIBBL 290-4]UTH72601.1 diguanylate cyclase [Chromobacterium sp. IIBBL 290-4]